MAVTLYHETLKSTLTGVDASLSAHFRGITYGEVSERFAEAKEALLPEELDCTKFGPRCPQLPVDVGHLLRIPRSVRMPEELEDELLCTNLDVVVPKLGSFTKSTKLPVLVWIHGGSQAVTFGSAASGLGDMTTIVEDSVRIGKPIIAVSIQYRLNIFAIGDGSGSNNLALRDQALGLRWVQKHIGAFGGDPKRVTVGGESAGAVYCHAHLVTEAPASQYILSSGTLGLSPPQPAEKVAALRGAVLDHLKTIDTGLDLRNALVPDLLEAVRMSGIQSWFLEWEDRFSAWEQSTGSAQRLLLSDVQKEAGVWSTAPDEIATAFDQATKNGQALKEIYHIYCDRPSSSRIGALDFVNDYKFVLPLERIHALWSAQKEKKVYRCLIDELNPWQPSSGAHHAIDLVLLFGGLDLGFAPAANETGKNMRQAWITFISGGEPWKSGRDSYYAFGPYGASKPVDKKELSSRRRMQQVWHLDKVEQNELDRLVGALVGGKISLLN